MCSLQEHSARSYREEIARQSTVHTERHSPDKVCDGCEPPLQPHMAEQAETTEND